MEKERLSRAGFIRLGAVAGAGATLAACGGGGGGAGEPAADEASPAGSEPGGKTSDAVESEGTQAAGAQGGEPIASEADVAVGSAVQFTDGDSGEDGVLVHLESGDFVAYSAVCTHQGCTVQYMDGDLLCPCHGSVFDPADGAAVKNGPANQPLPEIPVEVRDGGVFRA